MQMHCLCCCRWMCSYRRPSLQRVLMLYRSSQIAIRQRYRAVHAINCSSATGIYIVSAGKSRVFPGIGPNPADSGFTGPWPGRSKRRRGRRGPGWPGSASRGSAGPFSSPVAPRFRHGVERVDVLLRPLPGGRGQVVDLDRGHGVEGGALFQVTGGVEPGARNRVPIVQRLRYRSSTVAASPSAGRSAVRSGRCGVSPPSSGARHGSGRRSPRGAVRGYASWPPACPGRRRWTAFRPAPVGRITGGSSPMPSIHARPMPAMQRRTRPSVWPERPYSLPAHVPGAVAGSGGRSHRTAVHVVEHIPPAVLRRRDRHHAGRAAPPGGGPRRGPARAASDHVAEPEPMAPWTPWRSGRIQWRTWPSGGRTHPGGWCRATVASHRRLHLRRGEAPAARVAPVPAPAQAAGQRVSACLTRPQCGGEPPGRPRTEMYGSIPHVRPIH